MARLLFLQRFIRLKQILLRNKIWRIRQDIKENNKSTFSLSSSFLSCLILYILSSFLIYPTILFARFNYIGTGINQITTFPGQSEFVVTMYGLSNQLGVFQQTASAMMQYKIGNGIDPGVGPISGTKPWLDYSASLGWAAMIYSGTSGVPDSTSSTNSLVLGQENGALIAGRVNANIFTCVGLNEWDYYFEALSSDAAWWLANFGNTNGIKPSGLNGYDTSPMSLEECYTVFTAYFQNRVTDLLGRVQSVTGHSNYEAYVGEWGAQCIGLEVGENIAFTQSKFAFARGGSIQWQVPWSVQMSPWYDGYVTTSAHLDYGHSLSLEIRMWLHAWFSGASMLTPENNISYFFETPNAPFALTSYGLAAVETFNFMWSHDRGETFMPVAIVMDHLTGYNGFMGVPWGTPNNAIIPSSYQQICDLFDFQIFPGSDFIHYPPSQLTESGYLVNTPYGEIYNYHLSNVSGKVLSSYPVILLVGDFTFDSNFTDNLQTALEGGSLLLISESQQTALGAEYDVLAASGNVEVLEPWTNPETGRSTAISNARLAQLVIEVLPFQLSGDPIEYTLSQTSTGWMIELINNNGVTKAPSTPAVVDPTQTATVQILCKLPFTSAQALFAGTTFTNPVNITVEVGPGAVEYVQFTN